MQDHEHRSPPQGPLTLEQLLRLKRAEKPEPDFWARFERELQQKQLRALVQPSLWGKIRAMVAAPWRAVAAFPVAAGGVAAVAAALSFLAVTGKDLAVGPDEAGVQEEVERQAEGSELAILEKGENSRTVDFPRQTDALFVVDALHPAKDPGSLESFRTVAVPETFIAASDGSAQYVIHSYTTGADDLSPGEPVLKF